jgi:hypothetical protein
MKGFLFFFCLWLSYAQAKEYVIRYQTLSAGSLFYIDTKEGEPVGKILRQNSSEGLFFCFVAQDTLLASGQAVVSDVLNLSLTLVDKENQQIGGFLAIIPNLYPTEYQIFNKSQQLIAKGYMNWIGSTFSLVDPENPTHYLATFFRPFFKLFNDNWHVDVLEENLIDLRLLCVLGAFQTACDLNLEISKFLR